MLWLNSGRVGEDLVLALEGSQAASYDIAGGRGDPCGRPGLRATSANRATTRVALHHDAPTPSVCLKRATSTAFPWFEY
jgi:hypothetical protein